MLRRPYNSIGKSFRRTGLALCQLLLAGAISAEQLLDKHLQAPVMVGQGQYKYLLWRVYDIALYATDRDFSGEPPFALRIQYHRDLTGESIARQSTALIRRQGFEDEMRLAAWYRQMEAIFPDVEKGKVLIGVRARDGSSRFYDENGEIGSINDPLFGRYFFDIWLGDQTQAPDLRAQLTGESRG